MQGCDRSADSAAGMARRRKPPRTVAISGAKAINPRGLGTESPKLDATRTKPKAVVSKIEQLIGAENWLAARRAIRAKLRLSPNDHWLLTRLGLTYYEERRYKKALQCSLRALAKAPDCPLVLWDYAGSLEMLDQTKAALKIYSLLTHRGIRRVAFDDCGEGLAWARGLIADCHYRVSHCYAALGRPNEAIESLKRHIKLRGPGCRSIYALATVRKELAGLKSARTRTGHH